MTVLRLALLAVLIQTAPLPQQVSPASIEGIVVKETGDPLAKATVALAPYVSSAQSIDIAQFPQEYAVTAASDGKFVIGNIRPGTYRMVATLDGYVRSEYGQRGPNGRGTLISLTGGERISGARIQMTPTGTISGRVLDRNGEPLIRALVQAQKRTFASGSPGLNFVQEVTTNDLGEYRLFWLAPGNYYVSATTVDIKPYVQVHAGALEIPGALPGVMVTSRTLEGGGVIEEASVPVYYPGTTNLQNAMRIEVRAGETRGGVDITAAPARVYRVRGRVIDGTTGSVVISQRPNDVMVGLSSRNENRIRTISQVSGGAFEIVGVLPGSYSLVAQTPLTNGMGMTPIEIGNADLENVSAVVRPPTNISGRITVEGRSNTATGPDDRGLTGAQITLRSDPLAGLQLQNNSAANSDGAFTIPSVRPGNYQVFVRNVPGMAGYVKSIRMGTDDGLYDRIRITGQPTASLEVVISPNAGRLEGTVLNARREAAANVTVVLIPDALRRNRIDLFLVATSDSSGRFHFDEGITPGTYELFAWEDVETGAWHDPEFMRLQETHGRSISFSEGTIESIELTAIPSR